MRYQIYKDTAATELETGIDMREKDTFQCERQRLLDTIDALKSRNRQNLWAFLWFLFIVLFFVCDAEAKGPDFRRSFWGDTVEQVKLVEDLQLAFEDLDKGREKLRYHVKLEGIQMTAYYDFVGGKLCRAGYIAFRTHYPDERLLQAFRDMERKLNDKYGLPDIGEDLNHPNKNLVWYSHAAKIVLSLRKYSGESPNLGLFYYSIELAHLSGAFKLDPY